VLEATGLLPSPAAFVTVHLAHYAGALCGLVGGARTFRPPNGVWYTPPESNNPRIESSCSASL
jgi:hypothetical protein